MIRNYVTEDYAYGFGIARSKPSTIGVDGLILPWWFVILLAAVTPGLWLYRRVTLPRRRQRRGLCTSCSYDLTGTLKAGGNTCPECGAAVINT